MAVNPNSRHIEQIVDMLRSSADMPMSATVDVVKKALELFGNPSYDEQIESFKALEPALAAIKELNPTFQYRLEADDLLHYFKRVTIVMPHAVEAMPYLFKVYGLDGAHCS